MSILHMDGLDAYASADDLTMQYGMNSVGFYPTAGRFGGGALYSNGGGQQLTKAGPFPIEVWLSFAINYNDNSGNQAVICKFTSMYTDEAMVAYNALTGQFLVFRGRQNQILGSSSSGMTTNTWHWIDIRYKGHPTEGIFEVWCDGTQVVNVTGACTVQSNTVIPNLISISMWDTGIAALRSCYYDDLIINDTTGTMNNGRMGDHRIETLQPTSDVGPNNGTPSSGTSHCAMVADASWDASTYVTLANTSGQEELFGFSALAGNPSSVAAVKFSHTSQKTNTEDASLKLVVVSGGSEHDGGNNALGTAWNRASLTLETDPHTNAAWTGAAINGVQAGVKVP